MFEGSLGPSIWRRSGEIARFGLEIGGRMRSRKLGRFPPPWSIEEANAACFIVKDHKRQALAYVYFLRARTHKDALCAASAIGPIEPLAQAQSPSVKYERNTASVIRHCNRNGPPLVG